MADADKTLKLLIELGVIGQADAMAAQDLLDKQKKTVKELADEELASSRKIVAAKNQEKEVLEQLKNLRAEAKNAGRDTADFDDAIKRMNHSLDEGGHALNSNRLRAELFRRSLMSFGAYIPGLEWAVYGLGTAMGALTAGIIGGGIAIEQIISQYQKWQANLDAIAEAARNPDFLAAINAQTDAMRSAADEAEAFAHSEQEIINKQSTLGDKLAAQLKLWEAIERARAGLTSAQKELAIANVQQGEESGQLGPAQAAKAKADIDKYYAEKEQKDREQAQDAEVKAKATALDAAKFNQADLDKKKAAADQAIAEANAHKAAVHLDPEEQQKKINDEIGKISELEQKLEFWRNGKERGLGDFFTKAGLSALHPFNTGIEAHVAEATETELRQAKTDLSQLRQQLAQSEAAKGPTQVQKDAAKDAAEAAKKNADLVGQLNKELADLTATIKATRPIEEAASSTHQRAVDVNTATTVSQAVARDVDTIHRAANAASPSAAATAAAVRALADIQSAMVNYNAAVVAKMNELHITIAALQAQVRGLNHGGQ